MVSGIVDPEVCSDMMIRTQAPGGLGDAPDYYCVSAAVRDRVNH